MNARTRHHATIVGLFALLLFFGSVPYASAQIDKHILGTGAWSKPVTDTDHTLRGRLLVYDDDARESINHVRVYLELQHIFEGGWPLPPEIHYDLDGAKRALQLKLCDGRGRTLPRETNYADRGSARIYPFWVTLPCDSLLRLRADIYTMGLTPKPKGLVVQVEDGIWIVPPHHRPVYLSGTFTPPLDRRSSAKHFVWQGTLELPPVKIPIR